MNFPISGTAIWQAFRKYFSPEAIAKKGGLMVRRFPISVGLLAALAGMLFLDAPTGEYKGLGLDAAIAARIYLFLAIGVAISIAATLWLEDVVNYTKQLLVTGAVMLLWGVYCVFLPVDEAGIAQRKILELWAIGAFSALAIFFICFLKRGRERAFWNFVLETFVPFGMATTFGVIIFVGLCGACFAMEALFDYDLGDNVMIYLATFCFVLFAPFYFMANIPDKANKYNDDIRQDKSSAILGLYILTPLAAIYAVILYAYLFKIIITWELPQGLVSWLVSVLACCGLMIITLLFPMRQLGKNEAVNILSRWFGVIILPLLMLMSVGIFRRLSDYGITVARLYLLLVNLWFYGIYAYIFITKAQRIKWILISAATIFLLTSIGPWSISNVTRHALTAEVKKALSETKIPGPVKIEREYAYTRTLDDKESLTKIQSKIHYLYTTYGKESVAQFFDPDADPAKKDSVLAEILEPPKDIKIPFRYFNGHVNNVYSTNKYNSFVNVSYNSGVRDRTIAFDFDKGHIIINVTENRRKFNVPIRKMVMQLVEMGDPNNRTERWFSGGGIDNIYQGDGYLILISAIEGSYNETQDEITVKSFSGYLFYDK
jgi:hypothetical protein